MSEKKLFNDISSALEQIELRGKGEKIRAFDLILFDKDKMPEDITKKFLDHINIKGFAGVGVVLNRDVLPLLKKCDDYRNIYRSLPKNTKHLYVWLPRKNNNINDCITHENSIHAKCQMDFLRDKIQRSKDKKGIYVARLKKNPLDALETMNKIIKKTSLIYKKYGEIPSTIFRGLSHFFSDKCSCLQITTLYAGEISGIIYNIFGNMKISPMYITGNEEKEEIVHNPELLTEDML